ncbi:MAG: hypothetical protein ACPHFQ_04710 [Paracoccaceae bacterium]
MGTMRDFGRVNGCFATLVNVTIQMTSAEWSILQKPQDIWTRAAN